MKNILVIDDDASLRKVICDLLKERGYLTEEAQDGAIAVDQLTSTTFDLILSDVMMPKSTGLELLTWVRDHKPETPVILMTGFSELYQASTALELGASGFIPKPFKREDLLNVIERTLMGEIAIQVPETNLDDQYYKISVDDFVMGSQINIDIYIRFSAKKYVMIAHTGEDIAPEKVTLFKEKGLAYLYVTRDDFKKYVGMGTALTKAISSNTDIAPERKINFLRHTSEIIVQHFWNNDINIEMLNQAKHVVETSVSLLSDSTDAFKLLESLNNQSDYTYAHSVGVSFHAAMIAKKIPWRSPLILFKLSLAGLLHDIGKKQLSKDLIAKARHDLSPDDVALLESHSMRGMEILAQIRDIPSDVIQIALQHHENAIGTGYPYRIKANKTHPLARVIAVADEFCYLSLPSLSGRGLPPQEALQRMVTFQAEKLDPHSLRALFTIYKVTPPESLVNGCNKQQLLKKGA